MPHADHLLLQPRAGDYLTAGCSISTVPAAFRSLFLAHRNLSYHPHIHYIVPAGAFEKDWNVDSRPVGSGVRALRYLSAYVFRTAISDKRILSVDDESVTFAYTDTRTGVDKLLSLKPFEFIPSFATHCPIIETATSAQASCTC